MARSSARIASCRWAFDFGLLRAIAMSASASSRRDRRLRMRACRGELGAVSRARTNRLPPEMHVGHRPVRMRQPPVQHLLRVSSTTAAPAGSSARFVRLVRVGFEVEEQRRQRGEMHVFVALVADDRVAAFVRDEAERRLDRLRAHVAEIVLEEHLVRQPSGASPRRNGSSERPSQARGTSRPIQSTIVGMTSIASVNASTRRAARRVGRRGADRG